MDEPNSFLTDMVPNDFNSSAELTKNEDWCRYRNRLMYESYLRRKFGENALDELRKQGEQMVHTTLNDSGIHNPKFFNKMFKDEEFVEDSSQHKSAIGAYKCPKQNNSIIGESGPSWESQMENHFHNQFNFLSPPFPYVNFRMNELTKDVLSTKVFVGACRHASHTSLTRLFSLFGEMELDSPYYPEKGFAFILFKNQMSVHNLLSYCIQDGMGRLWIKLNNPWAENGTSQIYASEQDQRIFVDDAGIRWLEIRAWSLRHSSFTDPRCRVKQLRYVHTDLTCLVSNLPKMFRASTLARVMAHYFGDVLFIQHRVDSKTMYPTGSALATFHLRESYDTACEAGGFKVRQRTMVRITPCTLPRGSLLRYAGASFGEEMTVVLPPAGGENNVEHRALRDTDFADQTRKMQ